ncbi:MAG: SpoIIIAH-like family protein [Lachnospiraceae bacterium]|jgi:stage III sporulation protein AH|nr:SpoIIIAH-like family protein [Lachnospiraceae bacterium]
MKRILKKNQVVLTLLAVMIAVAGYLNYTADSRDAEAQAAASGDGNAAGGMLDISDEDILAENDALSAALQETFSGSDETTGAAQPGATQAEGTSGKTEEGNTTAGTQLTDGQAEDPQDSVDDIPGTAVLTGGSTILDYVAGVQLSREQTRAKNKEMLMEIIDNANLEEAQKQEAINSMLNLTAIAEKETAAESLLAAKGFENSIVYINDDSVDVVISRQALSDAERAQVEDIVKRKTEVGADKIVITLLETEN